MQAMQQPSAAAGDSVCIFSFALFMKQVIIPSTHPWFLQSSSRFRQDPVPGQDVVYSLLDEESFDGSMFPS